MSDHAAPDTTGLREVHAECGQPWADHVDDGVQMLCPDPVCNDNDCPHSGQACPYPAEGCPATEPTAGDAGDHAALTDERQRVTENPHESDNDATAELVVADALTAHPTTPTAASLAADLRATGETDAARRLADGLRGSS